MRIGYQGMEGSNSQAAARQMIEELNIEDATLIPLVTSEKVATELRQGSIDAGVFAMQNTLGGVVVETKNALTHLPYESMGRYTMQVHQYLYKLPGIDVKDITCIASHIQALSQTAANRARLFPGAGELEVKDTAICAKYLTEGILLPSTAVICSKEAGEHYGLDLLEGCFEDRDDNFTTFEMIELAAV